MDKIKYLTEKIKSLAVEVDILKEEISAANVEDIKNLQQLRLDVSSLETDLKNAISTNKESLTSLQNQASAQQTDIATNKENISSLQTLATSQGEQIETNKSNVAANSTKIATNAANIATNTTKIAASTTKIAANEDKIAANTTDIATNASKIATNMSNIATNTSNIATNTSKISENSTKIEQNVNAIAENKANISALDTRTSENTTSIVNLSTRLSSDESEIETLSTKIATTETDISSLDNRMTSNETQLSTLTGKVNKNETNIATLSDDVETNKSDISSLGTRTSEGETKIAANAANIATNTSKIATNTSKIASNEAKIAENETKIAQNTSDIVQNATNIAQNTTNVTKHSEDIVKIGEKLFNLETSQSTLSSSLENHTNDFYMERNKLQHMTGEFYGENLLQNPYLTCNQRNMLINQATACFMADRWYKACTNQVKVNVKASGIFEMRFLKVLTEPVRAIEQRIDIPSFFANRKIVASLTMMSCTTTAENSGCFGLEFFDSTGASLGVESYKINTIGDKYLKCTIPENTTSMTFFFQINPAVQRAKLMRFTNPKVEFGTVASKFGGRSDDYELSLCQKYYYASGVSDEGAMTLKAISATEFEPSVIFLPTKMAKTPQITLLSPTNVQNTLSCVESGGADITVSAVPIFDGKQCFKIVATDAVVGNHYKLGGYTADAETLPQNVNITDGTTSEE